MLYMLDTNTVSHIIKSNSTVIQHLIDVPMSSLAISAITNAELFFGLAKRPDAKKLHLAVNEFLLRVQVLPWDSSITKTYGELRYNLESIGKPLAPLDLLIASHALSLNAILVTNDQAFSHVNNLQIQDWTISP